MEQNKIKHTPGRWHTKPSGRGFSIERVTEHKTGTTYGAVGIEVANLGFTPESHDRTEANALLIAAAPELLEACKAARAMLVQVWGETEDASLLTDAERKALLLTRAAIAKAEGGVK